MDLENVMVLLAGELSAPLAHQICEGSAFTLTTSNPSYTQVHNMDIRITT